MSRGTPKCHTVTVLTFRGDRTQFGQSIRQKLYDAENGLGGGPSAIECLLYAGHTGVLMDERKKIQGFNPDFGNKPIWQAMNELRNGDAFPGVVRDDTQGFADAEARNLQLLMLRVILPDWGFRAFHDKLNRQSKKSSYTYGFPNGDGDCNCTTWLEQLGYPCSAGAWTSSRHFRVSPTIQRDDSGNASSGEVIQ